MVDFNPDRKVRQSPNEDAEAVRLAMSPHRSSRGFVALGYSRSDVLCPRPNQAVIGAPLEDVRGPPGDSAHCENRREEIDGNPAARGRWLPSKSRHWHSGSSLLFDQRLDALRELEPNRLPGPLTKIAGHLTQVRGARILRVIHAVAKAWNFSFLASLPLMMPSTSLDRAVRPDVRGACA